MTGMAQAGGRPGLGRWVLAAGGGRLLRRDGKAQETADEGAAVIRVA